MASWRSGHLCFDDDDDDDDDEGGLRVARCDATRAGQPTLLRAGRLLACLAAWAGSPPVRRGTARLVAHARVVPGCWLPSWLPVGRRAASPLFLQARRQAAGRRQGGLSWPAAAAAARCGGRQPEGWGQPGQPKSRIPGQAA
ncbi:uncharacterized protein PSFLO_00307 [Pseudozyma flocculosa]|uniref:Uncharacterized protein n=1 Tax=Pseudozyma flocculosa TaxID=84751 RepID=A0A5C3ETI2_9BASI|nr:uncharacterized protein PSFLO_00307 [Pseudozyma flocculosa]